jgi:hypothetical protein
VLLDDSGYLVYDPDVQQAGYTVVANLNDNPIAAADVTFAAA